MRERKREIERFESSIRKNVKRKHIRESEYTHNSYSYTEHVIGFSLSYLESIVREREREST